jgi:gas vesicle protein
MSSTSDTLLAFLLGAAVGGAAGLLLAPNTGPTTRKKLKKGIAELQNRGEGMYEEAEKAIEDKAQEIASLAKSQVEAVKGAVNEGKSAYFKELKKA